MLQVRIIKPTESANTYCTSDRVACTTIVNIKETFTGNDGLLQMFMWSMDCSQTIKVLLLNKFSI